MHWANVRDSMRAAHKMRIIKVEADTKRATDKTK
jgi:hypothetical protein